MTRVVVLPPGPRCVQCGHMPCPCCLDWCDTLTDDDDADLCCGGECSFRRGEVARWVASWPSDATGALFGESVRLRVADGPWLG